MGVGIALAAAGLGLQLYGMYEAGQARKDAAGQSAEAARRAAEFAKIKAKREVDTLKREARGFKSSQVAAAGAGGAAGVGSAAVVGQEADFLTMMDIEAIKRESKFATEFNLAESKALSAKQRSIGKATQISIAATALTGGAQFFKE